MEESAAVTRDRVAAVLSRDVRPAVFWPTAPVEAVARHVHGEPVGVDVAGAGPFEPFTVGDRWGAAWETTWFRFLGRVPGEWRGAEVVLRVGLGYRGAPGFGAEGIVWEDGVPVQGVSPKHPDFRVTAKAEGGEAVDVLVEAAANPVADLDVRPAPSLDPDYGGVPLFRLDRAELAVRNTEVEALALDMAVLLDLYDHLPAGELRAARVLGALNEACNLVDPADVAGSAALAREALSGVLADRNGSSVHRLCAVGNAHIDTAWLWPFRETARKCARTFSTALRLMDEYPEYRFACSQPQQLAWVKEQYPALFARIKERVADGRFELVGAMWVEADCNVPSGESLVRQLVHGARFLEDEFGVTAGEVWLPDVFGYSASLPQIMRLAGIERFLTQKLSWNTVNRMPHQTFWWEGIDGSRVLTHFPPADTYNGVFSMEQLTHNARTFRDHRVAGGSLYLFGYGDGGGGPTRELLEKATRMWDLEGAPRVSLSTVSEFWLSAASDLSTAGDDAPSWVGELYFEYHRGTYTTSGMSKRENRACELLLREAELWSSVRPSPWESYPAAALDAAWKDVLLLQFHDVLPGTSIAWVYRDSKERYEAVRAVASGVVDQAVGALAEGLAGPGVAVFNPCSFARREVVDGVGMVSVPALGYAVVNPAGSEVPVAPVSVTDRTLENAHLQVTWDDEGLLVSVWDKEAGREVLAPGARGNVLQLLDDRPVRWDAWDVEAFAGERAEDLVRLDSFAVVSAGPLVGGVEFGRSFGRSRVVQRMVLRADSRRLDFVTEVDWHEDRKLLKAAFPVDVHARRATYEIQYGHVERPTHRNTSWDLARFEVCAHKWADLTEPGGGYGVALLNDSKYGYDILGNVMRLSLLRAPVSPSPVMDRGRHTFTYALLPHVGDFRAAGVIEEAYALNMPLRVVPVGPGAGGGGGGSGAGGSGDPLGSWSAFTVSDPGVFIEAVKRAERSDTLIVRLYEAWGRRVVASVATGLSVVSASRVDLLEREDSPVALDAGRAVTLDLRPFEIVTLRYKLA
jgi:alpha-mannosidase